MLFISIINEIKYRMFVEMFCAYMIKCANVLYTASSYACSYVCSKPIRSM